jgi:hypothetical protein
MSLPNYNGCLMELYKSLSLYYTKMCFKILNFFVHIQSFSRAIYFRLAGFFRNWDLHRQHIKALSNYYTDMYLDEEHILKCHSLQVSLPTLWHVGCWPVLNEHRRHLIYSLFRHLGCQNPFHFLTSYEPYLIQ